MNVLLDIIIIIFVILGTYAGARKGLLKTLVGLIGLVAIVIISCSLRIPVANFLIDKMPFLNFSGTIEGLTSLNILIYNIIAFIIIFGVLYAILNIILALTGIIDTLLKFTVIWVIPSKIGGALLGFLEAWVFVFLVLFIFVQFSFSSTFITNSKAANVVLDNTPLVGNYLKGAKNAAINIYDTIEEYSKNEIKDIKKMNSDILNIEIDNGLITKEKVNKLIANGKLKIDESSGKELEND